MISIVPYARRVSLVSGTGVILASLGCGAGGGIVFNPESQCHIVNRHLWIESGLSGSQVEDPKCPVLISWNGLLTNYSFLVPADDLSKLHGTRYGRVAFYDHQLNLISGMNQHVAFFWNGSIGQVFGAYLAGSDSSGAGKYQGTDYGRIRVYLATGDSARAEVFLDYRHRFPAILSGPTLGESGEWLSFNVDASSEYRPVLYEWFVNDASQGAAAPHAYNFGASFPDTGQHEVRVRVTPGHTISPYELPIAIEIGEAEGCGGEGQLPCTAPPDSGMSSTKAGRAPRRTEPR